MKIRIKVQCLWHSIPFCVLMVLQMACSPRVQTSPASPPCAFYTEWHQLRGYYVDSLFTVIARYAHYSEASFGEPLDLRPIDTVNGVMIGNAVNILVWVSDALCEDFRDRPIAYKSYVGISDSVLYQKLKVDTTFPLVRYRERFNNAYTIDLSYSRMQGDSPGHGVRLRVKDNIIQSAGPTGVYSH